MEITGGMVFTPDGCFARMPVQIKGQYIAKVGSGQREAEGGAKTYNAEGCYVVPGFTDIHFHGCDGADLCDGTTDAIRRMGRYELTRGVTQICPSVMATDEVSLLRVLRSAVAYGEMKDEMAADFCGIHLEGPFLAKEKCGAQNPEYVRMPDERACGAWLDAAEGLVKMMTIAPELPGAGELIGKVHDRITVAVGHTCAEYQTAARAFAKGASHVTHLFNAMPLFHHRDTGVVGAAFDNQNVTVELICDGIHVSDSMIRAAFSMFKAERIVLVSDSMRATGLGDGAYELGGQEVFVAGKRAVLSDGTLAGSVSSLLDCIRHGVQIGIPLPDLLTAATSNPARVIGIDETYGTIAEGKIANLLILDEKLQIRDIFFHGKRV